MMHHMSAACVGTSFASSRGRAACRASSSFEHVRAPNSALEIKKTATRNFQLELAAAYVGCIARQGQSSAVERLPKPLGAPRSCMLHTAPDLSATATPPMRACSVYMRGPKRLPSYEPEARWSVHETFVEAAGRGLSRPPRPEAEGHLRACMSEPEGLPRPRQV
eukprot:364466-Chlamydomonas_euryale.AAC.13